MGHGSLSEEEEAAGGQGGKTTTTTTLDDKAAEMLRRAFDRFKHAVGAPSATARTPAGNGKGDLVVVSVSIRLKGATKDRTGAEDMGKDDMSEGYTLDVPSSQGTS